MKVLFSKLKESFISVLPVALIVVILNFTPLITLTLTELAYFLISAVFLIIGIALFNLGAELAMTPMGEKTGSGLAKSGKIPLLLFVCLLMGVLITVAEPDLAVLASQVDGFINGTLLIVFVGIGVGLFLLLSIIRIVTKQRLNALLMFFYMILFALTALIIINENTGFLALAFDSGGVTTGPITVPFIMALGVGVAATLGGKDTSENSFGLIAMCSIGPIIAVMALGMTASGNIDYQVPSYDILPLDKLPHLLLDTAIEVGIALLLIVAFFAVIQIFFLKLPKRKLFQIAIGIVYTFLGLVIFLSAVTVGFMPIGYKMGFALANSSPVVLVVVGFVLGLAVVFAEPAVHVLKHQVEDVTDGTVSQKSMLIALCVGVGISIGLSMLRIIFQFNILYYLIPGYVLSLGLSFFVPKIYTSIAFDSGGVASGPLTSTFILPLAIGACVALHGNVMSDAFGIVAMVAMTPLITIQLLGFKAVITQRAKERIAMKRILEAGDEQIINFM